MRRRRSIEAADDSNGVNLTPMLDVVFIMLIFFIVTTSFIKESGVEIDSLERNGVVCSQYRSSSLQSVPWVRWITGIIATVKKALSGMGEHRC